MKNPIKFAENDWLYPHFHIFGIALMIVMLLYVALNIPT